jgi:RNA polymerase sigma-70 factor (ECF subfamily)
VYPHYFRRLYREAKGQEFGLALPDFCQALEQIGRTQLPACASAAEAADFYKRLHLKDLALAVACSQGIAGAWEYFAHGYRERLYRTALIIARNDSVARELADSLCSELFVNRTRKLASYTGRGSLDGWLKALLAQSYIDRYRSQRRDLSLDEQTVAIRHACVSDWCEVSRVDPRLNDAINEAFIALPPENRYLLASYFFDRQTLAEIARTLTVHESTVSRRLDRLVRLLRRRIARLLRDKGMTARQAEESLQTDVRDISLDLHSQLLRGAELAGK